MVFLSLQANAGTLPRIGHGRFLPNYFRPIHQSSHHPTPQSVRYRPCRKTSVEANGRDVTTARGQGRRAISSGPFRIARTVVL